MSESFTCGEITVPVQPITKPVWKSVGRFGGHWGSKTYQKFLKDIGEEGYFKVRWQELPMDHETFSIFNDRRIQWELAND